MDNGDGIPEIRELVIWVLIRLGVEIPRSLSARRPSARGNYWLDVGARVRRLLVIPCPSQEAVGMGATLGATKQSHGQQCATGGCMLYSGISSSISIGATQRLHGAMASAELR